VVRAWWIVVLAVAPACRQILGLDQPERTPIADTALERDAAIDAIDATDAAQLIGCAVDAGTLSASVTATANGGLTTLTVDAIKVAGAGQQVTAPASSAVTFEFQYTLIDTSCPGNGCIDQIEIGLVPGNRTSCPFDGVVSPQNGVAGMASGSFTAPAMPGAYDVRINIGQNYSCTHDGASTWWNGTPGPSSTIARLCVQ
jgi:hypothetical protein